MRNKQKNSIHQGTRFPEGSQTQYSNIGRRNYDGKYISNLLVLGETLMTKGGSDVGWGKDPSVQLNPIQLN